MARARVQLNQADEETKRKTCNGFAVVQAPDEILKEGTVQMEAEIEEREKRYIEHTSVPPATFPLHRRAPQLAPTSALTFDVAGNILLTQALSNEEQICQMPKPRMRRTRGGVSVQAVIAGDYSDAVSRPEFQWTVEGKMHFFERRLGRIRGNAQKGSKQ